MSQEQPTPVDPNDLGINYWMHEENFVNEKQERLSFQDHMFLIDPYDDFSRRQVYKKCSQVGVSVMMNMKSFYALKAYQWNIIYTLPSDSDVEEFVPTKTDKMIAANPVLKNALQSDKVSLKQMYDRFLYYKGTRSKTAAIMTTADLLIHDEKDRSDQSVLEGYRSRTKKSKYKGIWELSNPSVKNTGVDVTWSRSDRKEWVVTCPHCKLEQILSWHENVDYVRKIYQCKQCGHEIDDTARRLGKWVAANPDSTISGYHISQLMAPWITAAELIEEEEDTDEEYFYNFILGEPIGEGDAEDFRRLVLDAWTPENLKAKGPHYMGIDIGSTKHYVIGNDRGIHTVGKLKTRQELEFLIEHWNPSAIVMDAGPERTWAEEFRKKYPRLWINFYKRDRQQKSPITWGDNDTKQGIVFSDRSRVIDMTVNDIVTADISFDLDAKDLNAYIKHWLVMVKKQEEDSLGLVRYVWDKNSSSAQDHWVHATVYYNIARSRGGKTTVLDGPGNQERPKLIVPTDDGFKENDLRDLMDRNML